MFKDFKCEDCELHKNITNHVIGEGNENAKIMIIGEAPGDREDKAGRPFVGASGSILNKALTEAGIKRKDVYIANICRCRPPENRKPKKSEIKACLPYLHMQIAKIQPDYIITLGNVPTKSLVSEIKVGIKKVWRNMFGYIGINGYASLVCPNYHPSYILRGFGRPFFDDFKQVFKDVKKMTERGG